MEQHERALQELRDWTVKTGGGLQILFSGHNPTIIDNIPHPWQCTASASSNTGELYHCYGVTFQDAVLKCYQRWLDQKAGYMWQEVKTETWFMTPAQWFEYQQNKPIGHALTDFELERPEP